MSDALRDEAPWRLLLISGSGRSGSTILHRLLGQYNGATTVGEAIRVWECSFHRNELCGCGAPLTKCPVWMPTLQASGVTAREDAGEVIRLRDRALRWIAILRLLAGVPDHATTNYVSLLTGVFDGISARTGASVIVDSSKSPLYTTLLTVAFRQRVSLVHLVRDPRAVAFSLQRLVVRPDVVDRVEYMPRYSPARSSFAWLRRNVQAELGGLLAQRRTRLRYEDLLIAPSQALDQLRSSLDLPEILPAFLDGHRATLERLHSVAGNPRRFEHGIIELKPDNEWAQAMQPKARRTVGILTAALRRRYGYE